MRTDGHGDLTGEEARCEVARGLGRAADETDYPAGTSVVPASCGGGVFFRHASMFASSLKSCVKHYIRCFPASAVCETQDTSAAGDAPRAIASPTSVESIIEFAGE